jgi:hypothetical protein
VRRQSGPVKEQPAIETPLAYRPVNATCTATCSLSCDASKTPNSNPASLITTAYDDRWSPLEPRRPYGGRHSVVATDAPRYAHGWDGLTTSRGET